MHQALSFDLPSVLRRAGLMTHTQPARRIVPLAKGAVTTVRRAEPAVMKVLSGQVWLTGTPAAGDLVLNSGENVKLEHAAPWVIEALADARVEIDAA